MRCISSSVVPIVLFLLVWRRVEGLKCYQCSSMNDDGCFNYNLEERYLKECGRSKGEPVCRVLSQLQFFTPNQDVAVIRECAYVYTRPLGCVQSRFSNMHYSLACECSADGCNRTSGRMRSNKLLVFVACLFYCIWNNAIPWRYSCTVIKYLDLIVT